MTIACQRPEIDLPADNKIVTLFLDGYVSNKAERVEVRFYQNGGKPELTLSHGPPNVGLEPCGSQLVANRLADDKNFYEKYFHPVHGSNLSPDLSNLVQRAYTFIAACAGREARDMDPEVCRTIGGHIHIAAITRKDGFRWIIAPKGHE
jgi:hypothetical protein